jgi:PAS domain-containing protein
MKVKAMNDENHFSLLVSKYKIISELAGHLIYDYDIKTGNIIWDGAIEKLTGFSSEEFQKVNIDVLITSDIKHHHALNAYNLKI